MIKKILALFLAASLSACASVPVSKNKNLRPKSFVTPWEYYTKTRPAVFTDKDEVKIKNAASQPIGDDTREDHTQAIIIGTVVGVLAVAGTVTGILLLK